MSLWSSLQAFNRATSAFQDAIADAPKETDIFESICPSCVLDLYASAGSSGTTSPLTGMFQTPDGKWQPLGESTKAILWEKCAAPFRTLITHLLPGSRPSYYALLLDIERDVVEAVGSTSTKRFTFAAFDRNPQAGSAEIPKYIAEFSTTALLYRLDQEAMRPIVIEWKAEANDNWSQLWNTDESHILQFQRWPPELISDLPTALFDSIRKLQGCENISTKTALAEKYQKTLEGYKAHVQHDTGQECRHFVGVFLPAISDRPDAAAFFLFDLTEGNREVTSKRLMLLSYVLSGSLNTWQSSLRSLLLPKYSDDPLTNDLLQGLLRIYRRISGRLKNDPSAEKDFCSHESFKVSERRDDYASILTEIGVTATHAKEEEALKAVFMVKCNGTVAHWPWPPGQDVFSCKALSAKFVEEVLLSLVGLDGIEMRPTNAREIHFPCVPALPFLLALRRLVLGLRHEDNNATILATDRKATFIWAEGLGHLRIPLKHPKVQDQKPTLREKWAQGTGYLSPGSICERIWQVLHAKVHFSPRPAGTPQHNEPTDIFDLYQKGYEQAVCAVNVTPHTIHFYWSGPSVGA